MGLLPDQFWSLNWVDWDSLLFNHRYKEQQALIGHRAVAVQVFNVAQALLSKRPKPSTAAKYWPLSLVDPVPKPPVELDPAWWAKMQERARQSGKKL